ncbi:MAG: 30S ribosomal protein S6 [Phycisphaerae bacterium]|nr:30S ribosomal protein S6 [Phycisphaerae bacterium]
MTDKKNYEGMFLVDAGSPDFEASSQPVRTVLERSEAELLAIKPWDERRLAYEIKGRKRGLYVLTYFKLDPAKVTELERDVELNEDILRMLVLRRDHLTDEQINAQTPAMAVERMADAEGDEKAGEGTEPAAGARAPAEEGEQVAAAAESADAAPLAESDTDSDSPSEEK